MLGRRTVHMNREIRIWSLPVLTLLSISGCQGIIGGCQRLPESVGPNQEILAFVDPTDWEVLETPLREAFEKVLLTPQKEKVFRIQRGELEDSEGLKHKLRKNLLVAAPLDATHPTSEFLGSLLSPNVRQGVRAGEFSVFWKKDLWARDQIVLFVTGAGLRDLVEGIRTEADRLYATVEQARNERVARLIYHYGERKDLTDRLAHAYGWQVRVSFGFELQDANADSGFVLLSKEDPSRWLFVYWEDGISPDRLTRDWCINKRDAITWRFFDGDRIAVGTAEATQTEFAGKLAFSLQGLWENEASWKGGPFKSYAFVDVDLDRFFFVDVGVFSPNRRKEPYLRQVDMMARTFKLRGVRN